MLEIEHLSASYGSVEALDDVSISVPAKSITAVLGANGAGKSTLLRTLSGLIRPTKGRVMLGGEEVTTRSVEDIVRLGMAHVPEGRGVIQELSVEENLRLGALWRHDRADRRRVLGEMYARFAPLASRQHASAFTLSGGERQMLVLARALMGRPRVLLLDEPSLGLAPLVVADIMSLLRTLVSDHGLTVLLVEQNARSALSIADRGVVLALGRVVASGEAADLAGDDDLRHLYLGF
jgi:branched-chain amino acid transport system ATP-binding protein